MHHFADQFGAVGKQARDDVIHVIDGEHDAADPEFVHRSFLGPSSDRFRTPCGNLPCSEPMTSWYQWKMTEK